MDYTIIPRSVKNTLDKAGCPLTEGQYMLLCGSLAATQQMVETMGLESTIEVLEPMA